MSNLRMNYDPKRMTWNEDDRTFFEEKIDTIYKRVAEVVITQNERFFKEIHQHELRMNSMEEKIVNHEVRIGRLEKKVLMKKLGRVAIIIGIMVVSLALIEFIILK